MKIKYTILLMTASAFLTSLVLADDGSTLNVKTFHAGEPAVAIDINDNFLTLTRAIKNNTRRLNRRVNKNVSHGEKSNDSFSRYGDGSAGDLLEGDWITSPQLNTNFSQCHLSNNLTVPSGTTIRCQSGFTLTSEAVIKVSFGFGTGVAVRQASGNAGGVGLYPTTAASSFGAFPLGGAGENGGGYIRIIADGDIVINGRIIANGNNGNPTTQEGGGAGGLIVLQSNSTIDTTLGFLQVTGGNGAQNNLILKTVNTNSLVIGFPRIPVTKGAGGGGGGIVVLQAPLVIAPASSIMTAGGIAGSSLFQYEIASNYTTRFGGSASGGNGGGYTEAGSVGYVIKFEHQ